MVVSLSAAAGTSGLSTYRRTKLPDDWKVQMPRARLILGAACLLSAAFMVAGCVTEPSQASARPPEIKAVAPGPGIPVSRTNKAYLVGCWTNVSFGDFGGALVAEPGEGVEWAYGDRICFDAEGHFSHSVSYGDEGLGMIGRYKISRKGIVKLDQSDVVWTGNDFGVSFVSKNQIRLMVYWNDDKERTPILLNRDPSDKYYLDMRKYF